MDVAKERTSQTDHPGLGHWRWQRLTAILLVPLILWTLWMMRSLDPGSYLSVREWIQQMGPMIALIILLPVSYLHGALGLQVIIEDYLSASVHSGLIWAVRIAAIALTLASLWAIFSIALA
jgi:succinate dehydrogenase / fumarate reductase membrane anchor subunit